MKFIKYSLFAVFVFLLTACGSEQEAQAAESEEGSELTISPVKKRSEPTSNVVSKELEEKLLAKFHAVRPDLEFSGVLPTSFPGLYELEFAQGGVIYVTESGDYFVSGELFKLSESGVTNLSEETRATRRLSMLGELDHKELITFPAAKGQEPLDIYVFTDVHCGYCAKLHNDVDELAKLGVRVNYLAFPRGGNRSQAYPIMQSVWCSDDRQSAITAAKRGDSIEPVQCPSTTVQKHFDIGNRAGVTGTPAIMFPNGALIAGYRSPSEIAQLAKSNR